jgi:hypothetical protein
MAVFGEFGNHGARNHREKQRFSPAQVNATPEIVETNWKSRRSKDF